jgi:hypothetical protein
LDYLFVLIDLMLNYLYYEFVKFLLIGENMQEKLSSAAKTTATAKSGTPAATAMSETATAHR